MSWFGWLGRQSEAAAHERARPELEARERAEAQAEGRRKLAQAQEDLARQARQSAVRGIAAAGGTAGVWEHGEGGGAFPGETMLERFARCAPPDIHRVARDAIGRGRDLREALGLSKLTHFEAGARIAEELRLDARLRYLWASVMLEERRAATAALISEARRTAEDARRAMKGAEMGARGGDGAAAGRSGGQGVGERVEPAEANA